MAVTAEQIIEKKDEGGLTAYPVANGSTIYSNTFSGVDKTGYLVNTSSSNYAQIRRIVVVADETANATGPAATTAAGSISGAKERASETAGDKTVRKCWTKGKFLATFTGTIAQSDVGKEVFLYDNFTLGVTAVAGIPVGILETYISATSGWMRLRETPVHNGIVKVKVALTAAATFDGGDMLAWANPTGETIIVRNLITDITTKTTGSPVTMNAGIAANGTTSSDTLINGPDIATAAAVFTAISDPGTNGKAFRKMTSSQYLTITPSASAAGLVGTAEIEYEYWE